MKAFNKTILPRTAGIYIDRLNLMFSQIIVRNLLRPVDLLPGLCLLGGIVSYPSMRGQRLGDLAANTVVIRIPETVALNTQALKESKYNSFRDYPHLEARLRYSVKPAEASLALDAIIRRDEIEPEARLKLFQHLADYFRSLVQFDAKVNDLISDEQYVRNTVASIYRQNHLKKQPVHQHMIPDKRSSA